MKFFKHKYAVLGSILILLTVMLYTDPGWLKSTEKSFRNINYSLRGNRDVNDNICLIYLGDEDLQALGEWPITRDYYSYLIYILKSSGAKTIGMDILFAHPDSRHPEYDKTLSDFMHMAGNVCIPMTFSQIIENDTSAMLGENPTFPFKDIRENAALTGFSNFGKDTYNELIPLRVSYNDSLYFSFGYQMAKNYLGKDNIGFDGDRILINHFGMMSQLKAMSFLKVLRTFQSDPDSLFFRDKLVLFAVTASGVATLKNTPLQESLPASLIHLTVAENLINNNYFTVLSKNSQLILLILTAFFLVFAGQKKRTVFILLPAILLIFFWGTSSFLLFYLFNIVLPLFILFLLIIFFTGYLLLGQQQQQSVNDSQIRAALQQEIDNRELQLYQLKNQLLSESSSAREAHSLAEQREQSILKLEKEINDLQVHILPQKKVSLKHSEIICSPGSPMVEILDLVTKVGNDDITVLILGQTGTGKELIARAIHRKSKRSHKPFIAVNCGALSENLLESELFGHEKGSFSGAVSSRKGRFEMASGGTIFLDEITETSASFQIKLLRVLQEGTFERLGGENTLKTNVRVIAASNKNIQDEIEKNNFRPDLYYRLNGFPIHIPGLRERLDDIDILSAHFLKKYGYNLEISAEVIKILKSYEWPGNVRELENIIRRAALLAQSENRRLIREKDLPDELKISGPDTGQNVYYSLDKQILDILRSFGFSHSAISQTAKVLDNRDRGTITEYFRGICFEYLVKENFDKKMAARKIAQTDKPEIIERVESKISTYMDNLQKDITTKQSALKGLPKKYHRYLEQIIAHLSG